MAKRDMLINVVEGEEVRIAVVQDGRLEELYMERASAGSHVGNIYKGKVVNVESSIQAAFIDFGEAKNGFLHISDLQPQYFPGNQQKEDVGKKTSRRDRPPIQRCLKRGQEIYKRVKNLRATLDELFEEPARAIARNIVVVALGFVPLLFAALVPYVTVGLFFLAIMALSGTATFLILPALLMARGRRAFWPWGARETTWQERPVQAVPVAKEA